MTSRHRLPDGERPSFGIGIACCNEAQNIGELLAALAADWETGRVPLRVAVVSDDSRDGTDELVRRFADRSAVPVVLEARAERRGKASAVNRVMELLDDADVIVLVSGDVLPMAGCIDRLLAPFDEPDVGVAGGRVVPEGPDEYLAVRVSRLLWQLHHRMALARPKSTEVTAFRNLHRPIDEASLVDEAHIEQQLCAAGYRIVYVPEAEVRSASPLSLSDYLRQRIRVTVGHLDLVERRGYEVGTLVVRDRLDALLDEARAGPIEVGTILAAVALESGVWLAARALRRRHRHQRGRWGRIGSAKRPLGRS